MTHAASSSISLIEWGTRFKRSGLEISTKKYSYPQALKQKI
jgi:hypothetical protein